MAESKYNLAANAAQLFPYVAIDHTDYVFRNTLGNLRRAVANVEYDLSVKVAAFEEINAGVIARQAANEIAYNTARAAELSAKSALGLAIETLSAAKSAHADTVKALAASTDPKQEKSLTSAREAASEAVTLAESALSVARANKADTWDATTRVVEAGEEIAEEIKKLAKPATIAAARAKAEERQEQAERDYNDLIAIVREQRTGERELTEAEVTATRLRLGLPRVDASGAPTVITWEQCYGLNDANLQYWRKTYKLTGLDRGSKKAEKLFR